MMVWRLLHLIGRLGWVQHVIAFIVLVALLLLLPNKPDLIEVNYLLRLLIFKAKIKAIYQ